MPAPAPVRPGASGFRDVTLPVKPKYRMIVSVMGLQKSGKNHFAYGAKGLKAVHTFEDGDEGVIEKFIRKGHKFKKAEYRLDLPPDAEPQAIVNKATLLWNSFRTNYALGLATADTSIVDTGTDMYELLRHAHFGKLQQVLAHHYAPVNMELKDLIRQAYSSDRSLIFLHRMKDEYVTTVRNGKEVSNRTGQKVFAGYAQMPFEVQIHLRAFRDTDGFQMEILDCRQNPDLNGFVLSQEMNNWQTLGTLVFPESSEEDWK